MSQESLNVDQSRKFWEQNDRCGKQTITHDSSYPIRSSSSAHNILSDVCSPAKNPRSGRLSAAGVWRTPLSQHPVPSTQPTRIDIPLTGARKSQTNPQTASMNQNLQVNRNVLAPPNRKPPQPWFPSQQPRSTSGGEGSAPTKHVSFQDPPAQPRPCLKTRGDPEQGTDVWRRRREAQAKPEKPKELGEVELLEQEVQRLWVKEERTTEENDRLRRLSLEWQFQKRLQEIQKKGDDDGEEEEDEDLDALLMMQQLERQTQASGTHVTHLCLGRCIKSSFLLQMERSSAASVNTDLKTTGMQAGPQRIDSRAKTGIRSFSL